MNQVCLIANHDKFPVLLNDQAIRIYFSDHPKYASSGMLDPEHCVMTDKTRLNFLGDVFDLDGMYSIGDFFIISGEYIWSFAPYVWLTLILKRVTEEC
jgi:hypothetical protein